jgi:hypothetical protein
MRWFWAMAAAVLAGASAEGGQAAPRNMEGGCEAYSWDMSREMAAWDRPAISLSALADGTAASTPAPLDKKLDVTLHPLAEARFSAPPERTPSGGYAGVVPITVPADGVYRIGAGSRVWIDVADGSQLVTPAKFEGHAACKVHKVVAFPLKARRSYRVQISGSDKPAVSLLVTAER